MNSLLIIGKLIIRRPNFSLIYWLVCMYVHVHMCVCVDVCYHVREKDSAFLLSCGFLGAQVVRYEASAFSPLSHPMAPVFSDFFFA